MDVNIVLLINDTDNKVMDSTVVPTPPPSLPSVGAVMPLLGGGAPLLTPIMLLALESAANVQQQMVHRLKWPHCLPGCHN